MSTPIRTLKGFRDYLPAEMMVLDRMLARVRAVFESFGYPPLQTPALEYGELLGGKYGEEGEMLMYRFRDHGDRDVCLRYDLTVPLARVVAQYGNLPVPFRRYQIAPVWRAEKPGRGRFREFIQCDVDLAGVDDAMADAEMILIDMAVISSQGLGAETAAGGGGFEIRVNHRGVLRGLTRGLGIPDGEREGTFLRILDKLPKIGEEKVARELEGELGLAPADLERVLRAVQRREDPDETIAALRETVGEDPAGESGLRRLEDVVSLVAAGQPAGALVVDPSIARGLSYYDGVIYETFLDALPELGSVMSGGRYNGLIGSLCGRDIPAVGNSLGVSRLLAALEELGQTADGSTPAQVLVTCFDAAGAAGSLEVAAQLRAGGVATQVYPGPAKLKKQLKYANQLGIPYVVVRGTEEAARGTVNLKNMGTGDQQELEVAAAIARITGSDSVS